MSVLCHEVGFRGDVLATFHDGSAGYLAIEPSETRSALSRHDESGRGIPQKIVFHETSLSIIVREE